MIQKPAESSKVISADLLSIVSSILKNVMPKWICVIYCQINCKRTVSILKTLVRNQIRLMLLHQMPMFQCLHGIPIKTARARFCNHIINICISI